MSASRESLAAVKPVRNDKRVLRSRGCVVGDNPSFASFNGGFPYKAFGRSRWSAGLECQLAYVCTLSLVGPEKQYYIYALVVFKYHLSHSKFR